MSEKQRLELFFKYFIAVTAANEREKEKVKRHLNCFASQLIPMFYERSTSSEGSVRVQKASRNIIILVNKLRSSGDSSPAYY